MSSTGGLGEVGSLDGSHAHLVIEDALYSRVAKLLLPEVHSKLGANSEPAWKGLSCASLTLVLIGYDCSVEVERFGSYKPYSLSVELLIDEAATWEVSEG
jgi:hypothetical protein